MHHMVPIFSTYTVNKPCPTSKQMLFPFQTHHVQIPAICFSRVSPYATQFSMPQVTHLFQQRSRFPGNKLIGSKEALLLKMGTSIIASFSLVFKAPCYIAYKANPGFLRDIQAIASEKVC